MADIKLKENESLEPLDKIGMKIIQRKDGFRFGIDSVLLPYFVDFTSAESVVEIGTGSGIIAMQTIYRYPNIRIKAVEIQEEIADMAKRNIEYNNLSAKVDVIEGNIKEFYPDKKVDAVITNPPYMKINEGKVSENRLKAISRHELELDLEELLQESQRLLKIGGTLNLIYRTNRFYEFIALLDKYKFSPRRIRFIYSKKGTDSILFMAEVVKGKNMNGSIMSPIYIYNEDGSYSDEVKSCY